MNILVVSSYPPMACGIAKYTEQQVTTLRREGHRVDVLTPLEGEGEFRDDLLGDWRPLKLLKYAWAYDELFIHYTPQFFYLSEDRKSRFKTSFALLFVMLLFGRRISVLLHETGFKIGGNEKGRVRYLIDRWYWRLARRVIFHSHRERQGFGEYYGLNINRSRFEVFPHDKYMVRHCNLNQQDARRQLNVEPNVVLLLCIGFIQPHKGFDRAIRALAQVSAPNLHLRIVGSVRLIWDKAHQYAHMLHDLADADPRVQVHEAFLSDELFDTWIVAADYIIVPYHEIWTSGVAARSKLYGRPLLAANIGGLAEQLTPGSALFGSDEELVEHLRRIAADHAPRPNDAAPPPIPASPQQLELQINSE
jgi:glycosyltransferase involved in cell wall biosynthesis